MLTAKQQALRRTGIGASEIAALAGLSRYARPIDVYASKVFGQEEIDSYQADLGTELEAPIARIWAQRHGKHLALVDTLQHRTCPLAIATPDRAIYDDPVLRGDGRKKRMDVRDALGLLQIKSSSWRMRQNWGEDGTDNVPDDYHAQCQWEAAVAGLAEVTLAVDFDKTKLHEYKIIADPNVFEALYGIAEKFWKDHVECRKPPPPDASPAYDDFLSRVYPKEGDGDFREISPGAEPELERAVAEFLFLREADKRLKGRRDQLHQIIRSGIGLAPGIKGAFGSVSYRKTKDGLKFDAETAFDDAVSYVRLHLNVNREDATAQRILTHLEKLKTENTRTRAGWRSLRPQPADHLKFVEPITLTLAADGEKGTDND